MRSLLALALLLTLGACGATDSEPVRACEQYLLAKLKAPATYKRIDTFSYVGDDKQLSVSIDYDAANVYGTPIREKQFCKFPMINGKPDTTSYIDHDAALLRDPLLDPAATAEIDGTASLPATKERAPAAAPEPVEEARQDEETNTIPAAFVGEWNQELEHCGTGLHDSRLRIGPQLVQFYESDGEVQKVTRHSARSITVVANYAGEGETWTNADKMVLSRSGNDLTIDGFTRHRCPG